MPIDDERISARAAVWNMAKEMVDPIIEADGVEEYRMSTNPSASIFHANNTTMTKVDQHLGHIEQVANWLLEET